MNSVVVTVLYLSRALHRRIIVYRILSKIQRIRASLATAIYDNKLLDCLLSRSQRLIGHSAVWVVVCVPKLGSIIVRCDRALCSCIPLLSSMIDHRTCD